MCSVESAYSPNNCNLIEEWALLSFPSNSPQLFVVEPVRATTEWNKGKGALSEKVEAGNKAEGTKDSKEQ